MSTREEEGSVYQLRRWADEWNGGRRNKMVDGGIEIEGELPVDDGRTEWNSG